MAKLRIGVIGAGTMGALNARLACENPDTVLVGICDLQETRALSLGEKYEVPAYSSVEDMIQSASCEAVVVATPDFAHLAPFLTAVREGCHILIEKPLAMDLLEAEQMVTAASAAGITVQVTFTNRWTPAYVTAHERLVSGELGNVLAINARQNNTILTPTLMLPWAHQTGPHWFLMSHSLDLVRWLSGQEVRRVYAYGVRKLLVEMGIDTYDVIHVIVELENGAAAVLESCWTLPEGMPLVYDMKFEIIGTKEALFVDTHDQMIHAVGSHYRHLRTLVVEIDGRLQGHSVSMFAGFVSSTLSGTTPRCTAEDGLAVVRILTAVDASLETGQPIELSHISRRPQ